MKLYLQNFSLPKMSSLSYEQKETNKIEFLSDYGKYSMIGDKIKLFKLNKTTKCILENFTENISLIASKEEWKPTKEVFFLPKNIIPFQIKTQTYKIDHKLSFVIERDRENQIIDYYFKTLYHLDDFCLKDELISFLTNLNNSF